MPTPFPARDAGRSSQIGHESTQPANSASSDWRCTECRKLLGVGRDGRMHLRFARGHEYLVGFPVTATCRSCSTLNQAVAPAR